MKKTITIEEKEDGLISLVVSKGVKWSTFIHGIVMLIEVIKENAEVPIGIDNILEDIKMIYERNKRDEKYNKNN